MSSRGSVPKGKKFFQVGRRKMEWPGRGKETRSRLPDLVKQKKSNSTGEATTSDEESVLPLSVFYVQKGEEGHLGKGGRASRMPKKYVWGHVLLPRERPHPDQ